MPVTKLLEQHAAQWARAVWHPFLDGVRDGSLPWSGFDTWLVQDHHFVEDLLWFQARLLARAPGTPRSVLAAGAVALVEELSWLGGVAERRGVALSGQQLTATKSAAELLRRLDEAPADVALIGLWAIERAYLDAWSYAAPGAPPFAEYVDHWTKPAFESYVDALTHVAGESATAVGDEVAGWVVAEVAVMEQKFWDMAYRGEA